MKRYLLLFLFFAAAASVAGLLNAEKERASIEDRLRTLAAKSQGEVKSVPSDIAQKTDGLSKRDDYGLDREIIAYLEGNLLEPVSNGSVFCSYNRFQEGQKELYLYALCEEFYLSGGKIYVGSGVGVPVRLTKNGDSYDKYVPRDGSFFTKDVQNNFPENFWNLSGSDDGTEWLEQVDRERAEKHFNASFDFNIEKQLDTPCRSDTECATPDEYQMMSRCRFAAKCLDGKCAVVCPRLYLPND